MTSLPITEVAHRTGFVDDRHLARHFVHWYGVTPGRYRRAPGGSGPGSVSYTHLRAHETGLDLVCRLLFEKKKQTTSLLIALVLLVPVR